MKKEFRNMNKNEMASFVADKTGLDKKTSGAAVDAMLESVGVTLAKGEEIRIPGFGTFSVVEKPARTGRNPQTGEIMEIAASKSPKFKPGKILKDTVNAA